MGAQTTGIAAAGQARLAVSDSVVSGRAGPAVHAGGEAVVTLDKTQLVDSLHNGIWASEQATVHCNEVTVSGAVYPAIAAGGTAQVEVRGGRISGASSVARWARDGGKIVAESLQIDDPAPTAVWAESTGTIALTRCTLDGGKRRALTTEQCNRIGLDAAAAIDEIVPADLEAAGAAAFGVAGRQAVAGRMRPDPLDAPAAVV